MGLILNGKYMNGLIYKGKEYIKHVPKRVVTYPYTFKKKVTPSAGSEYTSGYAATFGITNSTFKLYRWDDLDNPLDYLPAHKFVFNNVTQQPLSGISLVYNGDGTFSLTGTLNLGTVYSSSKTANLCTALLDENDNLFVADKAILTSSISTSSTTASFTGSTLTYENESGEFIESTEVSLPYVIPKTPTSGPKMYSTISTSADFTYSGISQVME